jgi:pimeloyl-ACP methyl ester carboxylesterase
VTRTRSASALFVDDAAKAKIAGWFEAFRGRLRFATDAREVATPFGRTHVLVAGPKDAPPLVVLHGAMASSAHVLPELGSLSAQYRVYAIDVLGQSVMSEDRRVDLHRDAYGHWMGAVARGLSLERFALLGVSYGGFVAMSAVRVAPELVRALVLLVPAGLVAGPAWPAFALAYRTDLRIPPRIRDGEQGPFRGPVLVFGADKDLQFPGRALLARAGALWPHAELELLPDCRHCPPLEDAFREKTAARVGRFLTSIGR